MLLTLLLTMAFAKLKGHKIKPILRAYDFYPVFVFEIFNIYLEINIFISNSEYIKLAEIIKTVYLAVYIVPIIYRKLYKPAIMGSISILVGTILNKIVIFANNGLMPIYPTFSKLTGYFKDDMFELNPGIHILGTGSTNLKFLCDYIDVGYSILSIGDLFIHAFAAIILYCTILTFSENKNDAKNIRTLRS